MITSNFFTLNKLDLLKGLAVAVIAVVLGALQQGVTMHGFNFGAYDWGSILNIALSAGAAYLTKNLFTTADGKTFGFIG
jgi:uncharacterized membrane protein